MRAQPSLHVHHRHAAVVPGLRGGHGRVGVPLDHHGRRALPYEQLAELLGDPPDLRVAGLAADAGEHVRDGQAGRGPEHPGQLVIGVLAGMESRACGPRMRTICASFTISGRVSMTTEIWGNAKSDGM